MSLHPESSGYIKRIDILEKISKEHFDVFIIGGGITGAGIALDATLRGLKVCLVEKRDFASGTSSKSTKLIHGGLRYLKNLEFGLVRNIGCERAINHNMAPLLVYPQKMLLPLRKDGSLSPFTAGLAIKIYDWLARVPKKDRLRMLDKEETLRILPILKPINLRGSALYTEYQTDDARLVVEIIKKASELGAVCLNYAEAENPIFQNNKGNHKVSGYNIKCKLTGKNIQVYGHCIVSAAGPWTDSIRLKHGANDSMLVLSRGIHIVVPAERFPLNTPVYMDVLKDPGRMIFCIPRRRHIYIGTTDIYFRGPLDEPAIPLEEIDYLIEAIHDQFNLPCNLTRQDVVAQWSGLRPLIKNPGKKSTEISRKDEIKILKDGLILIAGGKLTGWRLMAKKIVNLCAQIVSKKTGQKFSMCQTEQIKLNNFVLSSYNSKDDIVDVVKDYAKQLPIQPYAAEDLVMNFGLTALQILDYAYNIYNINRNHPHPLLEAEVKYAIENEWACYPEDYFERRTSKTYFNTNDLSKEKTLAKEYFSKYFSCKAISTHDRV